jgi:hypothetical protein
MITTVSRQKFLAAISNNSDMYATFDGLTADANNPAWTEFYSAQYISYQDPLYQSTQMALGLTSDQMLTLFQEAVAL